MLNQSSQNQSVKLLALVFIHHWVEFFWVEVVTAFHPCHRILRGRRGRTQWCSGCETAHGIRGYCGTNPRCAPASDSIAA